MDEPKRDYMKEKDYKIPELWNVGGRSKIKQILQSTIKSRQNFPTRGHYLLIPYLKK